VSITSALITAALVVILTADAVLAYLGFLTISQTIRGWGLQATLVPVLGGALGGHLWHDLVPSLALKPLPAHMAFVASVVLIAGVAAAMQKLGHPAPMEILACAGWVVTAMTVGV
jgi:hypothetical protein